MSTCPRFKPAVARIQSSDREVCARRMTHVISAWVLTLAASAASYCQQVKPPSFAVASIRRSVENTAASEIEASPGRLTMRNISLGECIQWAWDLTRSQVKGEDWVTSVRYDLNAVAETAASRREMKAMLQSLLAERFGLVSHIETRVMPGYELTAAKGGPKIKPSAGDHEGRITPGHHVVVGDHASIAQLTDLLGLLVRAPVSDQTGLSGVYDFQLDTTEVIRVDPNAPDGGVADLPARWATAVREQLGLELKQKRISLEVRVVDHAEKTPSEN